MQFFSHPLYLASVISIFMLLITLGSWRWYMLNSAQRVNLDFTSTFISTYIGAGYSNILPGTVGGDFVRWFYLLKKIPDKKSSVLFSLFLDRVLGFVGVFIAVGIIFATRMQALLQNPALYYPFVLLSLLCIAILATFFTLITLSGRIPFSEFLMRRFPENKWAKHAASLFNALRVYRISKSSIAKCLLISIGIQLVMAVAVKIIAEVMGFSGISLTDYLIAASLTQIVNLIPATPGGIGIGEMAFANILILLNPGTSAAYATVYFAFRVIGSLTYLPGVILFIPKMLALKLNRAAA